MANVKVKVISARDCGLLVYRLIIWVNGRLVLLRTHASKEGAVSQWLALQANPARLQALTEMAA